MNKWIVICMCALLLCGCGANSSSPAQTIQPSQTEPSPSQTQAQESQIQPSQSPPAPSHAQDEQVPSSPSQTQTASPQAQSGQTKQDTSSQTQAGQTKQDTSSQAVPKGTAKSTGTNKISRQKALEIALSHAGVKENSLTSKRIKLDWEDGAQVYDIEFHVNEMEYDYEVRTSDGKIVKSDREIDDDFNNKGNSPDTGKEITKEEAKQIALKKVPGAKQIKIKRDLEDGKAVYEGEIHHNSNEYEFEIDASTGKILKWEID